VEPQRGAAVAIRGVSAGDTQEDTRQLAMASAEGMAGGEETKLHVVLKAKESLEMPCVFAAYQTVVQDLRARTRGDRR
jgi:hypothetical protein